MSTSTTPATRDLPELASPTTPRRPRIFRRTLPSGLRVAALRKNETPIVELRLRIPLAVTTPKMLARVELLSETMMAGTATRDRHELEQALGLLGADLNVGHDADKLTIGGNVLAEHLEEYVTLLGEVLREATYPKVDVERERARVAEHLQVANASAGTAAAKALAKRMYGAHRYSLALPESADIVSVGPASVRSLHRSHVLPSDAVLVLVGDLQPGKTLDLVERTLHDWQGTASARRAPKDPFAGTSGGPAVTLVDRRGSVQSAIRVGLPGVGRTDEQYAAARVASMLFGGYFSSRLVANLREDKGYTYTPRSGISLHDEGAAITVSADVSTEVTGAALNEIRYELGKIATTRATEEELENARQYLIGGGLLSLSTQAGLATTAASMEYGDVGFEFLWEHQKQLARVTADDVLAVSERLLNPELGRYVVVGDAERVEPQLTLLAPVQRG